VTGPTPDLLRGLITRRTALIGLGGAGLSALLAGCDSGSSKGATAAATRDFSDAEKVINWSNWPDYIDVDSDSGSHPTLDEFTKRTGIRVNYTEDYNANEEFYTKVQPQFAAGQDVGRDSWCATDWMVARLIRQGYLQKLDKSNIPNAANLQPSLRNVEYDPGRQYSLPWQSGFTGIGYNPKATNGKKIESVEQLFTDPSLKGRVTLLTEMQDTMGLVMPDMGIPPRSLTPTSTTQLPAYDRSRRPGSSRASPAMTTQRAWRLDRSPPASRIRVTSCNCTTTTQHLATACPSAGT
jgi:spermidine/putrescine transport system substrate-binding protein